MKMYKATTTALAVTLLLAGSLSAVSARNHENNRYNRQERTISRSSEPHKKISHRKKQIAKKKVVVSHSRKSPSRTIVTHKPAQKVYRSLPRGYRKVRVANKHYYHGKGNYYTKCHGGYKIVKAPRIRYLPRHARRVVVNRTVYYTCNNIYYTPRGNYYEVCEAPHYNSRFILSAGPLTIVLDDHDCGY